MLKVLFILYLIASFLPLLKSRNWLIRGQAYFKIYYLVLGIFLFSLSIYFQVSLIFTISLVIAICYNFSFIYSLMPFFTKKIKSADITNEDMKLLSWNVYQHNNSYADCIELILKRNCDVVVLFEINRKWHDALEVIFDIYPFRVKRILENTYGVLVLSKIAFHSSEIIHFVKNDIPTVYFSLFHQKVLINLFAVHPEPPLPGFSLSTINKDLEFYLLSDFILLNKLENVIVVGDFNDVSWSRTIKLLKKRAKLYDVRTGRGFYNTFPVYSPIRIPIDNLLCTSNFSLSKIEVLQCNNSDHFPVVYNLKLM